jgi:hypothetical protein
LLTHQCKPVFKERKGRPISVYGQPQDSFLFYVVTKRHRYRFITTAIKIMTAPSFLFVALCSQLAARWLKVVTQAG